MKRMIKGEKMEKLKLLNIKKTYDLGDTKVEALKGISLGFRGNEFVSILGPSGCGKTTLLNIIGGLDKYDSGDLIINGISTKKYKDRDWDAYRNSQIGFVFQSYNLIAHLTVLQNVEIALTLSGVSKKERRNRAKKVLAEVGLENQINKKPNQLSGGQMQRVAIARALVNNPNIILADEPTGALDTKTSFQIMDILKNISKTKLIIMVTHNQEIAKKYSSRIVNLVDGLIISDSAKKENNKKDNEYIYNDKIKKRTAMSWLTALSLSFRNLLTKKNRTIITSIAGSIGIIGVALVLALSNGLSNYIGKMQSESLAGFPLSISTAEQNVDMTNRSDSRFDNDKNDSNYEEFPKENIIYNYNRDLNTETHKNVVTKEYLSYIADLENKLPGAINNISYTVGVNFNLLTKPSSNAVLYDLYTNPYTGFPGGMNLSNSYFEEIPNNDDFVLSLYDLIGEGSRLPKEIDEIVLVVDEYNRIDSKFFEKLGISASKKTFKLTDYINKELIKVVPNNNFYLENNGIFAKVSANKYNELYDNDSGIKLKVVGVLRIKKNAASSYLSEGIAYTKALTDYIVNDAKNSRVALAQQNNEIDVLTGLPFFNETAKEDRLASLGVTTIPTGIDIYPKDFDSKDEIKAYLDEYNKDKSAKEKIIYSDMAELITSVTGTLINTVTYVLVGFAAISLIVSTIMIGIITYVSVIERTKEIGILRSVGARKKDITRMFNAETLIIGFASGTLGVIISYLLTIPINKVIYSLVEIEKIAVLNITSAVLLIIGSMFLTLIAGFFPSRLAAKKDPVIALRTE